MAAKSSQSGFTLIELLVAVAMLVAVSVAAISGLSAILNARDATREAGEALTNLQRAFVFLEQDISMMSNRPMRDAYGTEQKAFNHGEFEDGIQLEFTRKGWPNPIDQPLSDMVRVAYEMVEDEEANEARSDGASVYKLYRVYWRQLDRAAEDPTRKRLVAKNVQSFKTRFMDNKNKWKTEWPPQNQTFSAQASGLPRAIEITLQLETWGEVRRVFEVAGR